MAKTINPKNVANYNIAKLEKESADKFTRELIPTGFRVLDGALNGGINTGSIYMFSADSGIGKSTTVLDICRVLCSKGYYCRYYDTEGGVNEDQIKKIGLQPYIDNYTFTLRQITHINTIVDELKDVHEKGLAQFIIIDSLGIIASNTYLSKNGSDVDNQKVGEYSKMMGPLFRNFCYYKNEYGTTFLLINQLRKGIGMFATKDTTGGVMTKYGVDVDVRFNKVSAKDGDLIMKAPTGEKKVYGKKITVELKKSRQGAADKDIPMFIYFGLGISNAETYYDLFLNKPGDSLVPIQITEKSSWISLVYRGSEIIKTRDKREVLVWIIQHDSLMQQAFPDSYFLIPTVDLSFMELAKSTQINQTTLEDLPQEEFISNICENEDYIATKLTNIPTNEIDLNNRNKYNYTIKSTGEVFENITEGSKEFYKIRKNSGVNIHEQDLIDQLCFMYDFDKDRNAYDAKTHMKIIINKDGTYSYDEKVLFNKENELDSSEY